jgi:hypothetical protein
MNDVWEMFRVVLDERKKREIDPTVALLRDCVAEATRTRKPTNTPNKSSRNWRTFFDTTTAWYGQIRQWPTGALTKFVKAGDKIQETVGHRRVVPAFLFGANFCDYGNDRPHRQATHRRLGLLRRRVRALSPLAAPSGTSPAPAWIQLRSAASRVDRPAQP